MGILGQTLTGNDPKSLAKKQNKLWEERNRSWLDARNQALERGKTLSQRAYQAYQGPRVAGLSGNEQQASTLAATGSAQPRSYFEKAGEQVDNLTPWNADTLKTFQNPYLDSVKKQVDTTFAQQQAKNQGRAAALGAFGSDRVALQDAALAGEHEKAIGDVYTQSYDKALQAWQADNATKLNASQAYNAVGGNIANLNSQQITDLMKTGQSDRLLKQMQMDVDYSNFIENRDWDVNNLDVLLRTLSATNESGGGMAVAGNGSNGIGEGIGAISSLVGYFGSRGKSSGGGNAGTYGSDNNASNFYTGGSGSNSGINQNLTLTGN